MGRTANSTFISLDAGAIDDHAGNTLVEVGSLTAEKAEVHTIDVASPTLDDFAVDPGLGILTLSFSENMSISTFELTSFVLQFAESCL